MRSRARVSLTDRPSVPPGSNAAWSIRAERRSPLSRQIGFRAGCILSCGNELSCRNQEVRTGFGAQRSTRRPMVSRSPETFARQPCESALLAWRRLDRSDRNRDCQAGDRGARRLPAPPRRVRGSARHEPRCGPSGGLRLAASAARHPRHVRVSASGSRSTAHCCVTRNIVCRRFCRCFGLASRGKPATFRRAPPPGSE